MRELSRSLKHESELEEEGKSFVRKDVRGYHFGLDKILKNLRSG